MWGDDDDFKSGAWVNATNYVTATGGTITGCLRDIKNFLKKGKLDEVVAIVKSCSPNDMVISIVVFLLPLIPTLSPLLGCIQIAEAIRLLDLDNQSFTYVMSSASSAVTYTSVYTDSEPGRVFWGADEEISDGGSPRVIVYGYDGLPMQPVDPPSPIEIPYIPESKNPEYLVPSEDEAPMEDQPLPADASPAALSPGYVPDSDLEEDPDEDFEEHADYPADGGDGDDEPSDDDSDDDTDDDVEPFEDEEDDEEEEEH
ncbi:hypothetical protein Tco_0145190 [Tanacetum coccineum]